MEPDGSLLRLDGTVIGEFVCDRVYEIAPLNHAPDDLEAQACMDRDQIWKYTHGKGYAWHITELKTYETPLDLSAFHLRCENALRWCNNGGCAMHIEQPANGNCCGNYGLQLNRPPQSWCYVVGPGECHKELQEQVKATLNRLYPRKKVSDIGEALGAIDDTPTVAAPNHDARENNPFAEEGVIACQFCRSGEWLYNEDGAPNAFCGQCGRRITWPEASEEAAARRAKE